MPLRLKEGRMVLRNSKGLSPSMAVAVVSDETVAVVVVAVARIRTHRIAAQAALEVTETGALCPIVKLIKKKFRIRSAKPRQNLRVQPAGEKAQKQNIVGREEMKHLKMLIQEKQMFCRLPNLLR